MVPVVTQALLAWLVAYAGLFAVVGFVLVVARGYSGRDWSNRALLRLASGVAFVLAAVLWLLVLIAG